MEICRKEDFEKAVAEEWDLVDLCDEVREFWYCQECKRITVIHRRKGKYMSAVFFREKREFPVSLDTAQNWQELLFWRDKEFYDAIEESEHRTVGDFVKAHPSRYLVRISRDLALVPVFSTQTKAYLFSYVKDSTQDSTVVD